MGIKEVGDSSEACFAVGLQITPRILEILVVDTRDIVQHLMELLANLLNDLLGEDVLDNEDAIDPEFLDLLLREVAQLDVVHCLHKSN